MADTRNLRLLAILAVGFLLSSLILTVNAGSVDFGAGWIRLGSGSGCKGTIGECLNFEHEFEVDSEIHRRILATSSYISYGALNKNRVPCSRRGASYYNCRPGAQANPYRPLALSALALTLSLLSVRNFPVSSRTLPLALVESASPVLPPATGLTRDHNRATHTTQSPTGLRFSLPALLRLRRLALGRVLVAGFWSPFLGSCSWSPESARACRSLAGFSSG
ncbi:hypothetical protein Cgig2_015191 [Carnegiea gigantea]|uniref:Protein RALF-like 33 n=1 Tax=Carnegiea gigantea TaxID=171969 RepID=A0A9Q1KS14_9CARY|nr:hypothetical protein Cgig2_015191 [Carnegiea gigantea]